MKKPTIIIILSVIMNSLSIANDIIDSETEKAKDRIQQISNGDDAMLKVISFMQVAIEVGSSANVKVAEGSLNTSVEGVLFPGMAPEAITDPEVRRKYELKIKKNNLLIRANNEKVNLKRLARRAISLAKEEIEILKKVEPVRARELLNLINTVNSTIIEKHSDIKK